MTTSTELRSLRRAVDSTPRGRGQFYGDELRTRVVGYASARREEGASWATLRAELGISAESLRRWCAPSAAGTELVAVRVVDDLASTTRTVSVVAPSGHRVDGLTLAEAAAMLRALA